MQIEFDFVSRQKCCPIRNAARGRESEKQTYKANTRLGDCLMASWSCLLWCRRYELACAKLLLLQNLLPILTYFFHFFSLSSLSALIPDSPVDCAARRATIPRCLRYPVRWLSVCRPFWRPTHPTNPQYYHIWPLHRVSAINQKKKKTKGMQQLKHESLLFSRLSQTKLRACVSRTSKKPQQQQQTVPEQQSNFNGISKISSSHWPPCPPTPTPTSSQTKSKTSFIRTRLRLRLPLPQVDSTKYARVFLV